MTRPVGMWEITLYTGLAEALFLLYFGLYQSARRQNNPHIALFLPVLGLSVFSLDRVYHYVRLFLPIPLLTGERVAARLILLPFLAILALAAIELQRWLDHPARPVWQKWLPVGVLAFLGNDLWQNFRQWRLVDAAEKFGPLTPFDPTHWQVANQMNDSAYFSLLAAGLILTLISAAVLIYLSWREQRAKRSAL